MASNIGKRERDAMLKLYYKLDEAAEYLSVESKQLLGCRDILEIAARGDIRLCFWFNGTLTIFKNVSPLEEPEFRSAPYTMRGYIQVPRSSIDPGGRVSEFDSANIIEEVESPDGGPPPMNWFPDEYFLGQYDCEPERGCFHTPFSVSIDEAVIPAADLLALTKDLKLNLTSETLVNIEGGHEQQQKEKWTDEKLRKLWDLSLEPGMNKTMLAAHFKITRQAIDKPLKRAQDKFSSKPKGRAFGL